MVELKEASVIFDKVKHIVHDHIIKLYLISKPNCGGIEMVIEGVVGSSILCKSENLRNDDPTKGIGVDKIIEESSFDVEDNAQLHSLIELIQMYHEEDIFKDSEDNQDVGGDVEDLVDTIVAKDGENIEVSPQARRHGEDALVGL